MPELNSLLKNLKQVLIGLRGNAVTTQEKWKYPEVDGGRKCHNVRMTS